MGPRRAAADQPGAPVKTDLCQIVNESERYNGKRVEFSAEVLSDGREGTVLSDDRCSLGITPWFPEQANARSGIENLKRALNSGHRGTLDKKIVAVFIGRFVWKAGSRPPVRALELEGVKALRVWKTKQ